MLLPSLLLTADAADVVAHYRTIGSSLVETLAADDDGGFLATGAFQGSLTLGGDVLVEQTDSQDYYDLFITHHGPSGTLQWHDQLVGYVPSVAWSRSGVIFAGNIGTGRVGVGTPGELTVHSRRSWDGMVARYGPDGTPLWAAGLTDMPDGTDHDRVFSTCATADGGIITGGWLRAEGGEHGIVVRHADDGIRAWARPLRGLLVMDIACVPDGVVVAGRDGVVRLEADGTVRWRTDVPDLPDTVSVTADGLIVTAGQGRASVLSADGELLWSEELLEGFNFTGSGVDAAGRIVLSGWGSEPPVSRVLWLSEEGALLRSARLTATGGLSLRDACITADGRTLVGGYFVGELEGGTTSAGMRDGVVLDVTADGPR